MTNPSKNNNDIADVQSRADARNIAIDQVGIKDLRHPLQIADRSGVQNTVATVNMYVALPPDRKGTHMSRFVNLLHAQREPISVATFDGLLTELAAQLDASAGSVEMTFPYFITKHAPATQAASVMDYRVTLRGEICDDGKARRSTLRVAVPVTSLCPCSKEISDYGAHSQRAHVTAEVCAAGITIEDLVEMVEAQASCELYGVLKRPDEKFITEKAYDNPKFVEDVVRDVAGVFNADARVEWYCVSVENFESIHNHSAFAQISCDKKTAAK